MRSVFVFLRDTTEADVASYLDLAYPVQREPWLFLSGNDPYLYIEFYRDGPREDPEVWGELTLRFGSEPTVGVVGNVSGRHPGDDQATEFVVDLLGRFSGIAMDDYTDHFWSLAELQAGHRVSGHPFFDHNGWFAERKADT